MSGKTHIRGQDWQGGRTRCGKLSDPRHPLTTIVEDELPTCAVCMRGDIADVKAGEFADIHPAYRHAKR